MSEDAQGAAEVENGPEPGPDDDAQQAAFARNPNYQSYLYNNHGIEQPSEYSMVEMLLMAICVLLTILILISLMRFCYQIYQNKNRKVSGIYKPVRNKSIDTDIDEEAQHLNEAK